MSTTEVTLVWVTVTHGAVTQVISSTWTQRFSSMYSTIGTVPTGAIGLGTIKGEVGTTRTYQVLNTSSTKASK